MLGAVRDVDWLSETEDEVDVASEESAEASMIVADADASLGFRRVGSFIFFILSAKRAWRPRSPWG